MSTPTAVDPSRTALLVMDYQPAVLGNFREASALVDRTAAAVAHAIQLWRAVRKGERTAISARVPWPLGCFREGTLTSRRRRDS
jgi:nicotinamidase-related amidase